MQMLMKWHQHGLSKEKRLLTQYGSWTTLLDPASPVRTATRQFPLTTFGSEKLIPKKHFNFEMPLCLRHLSLWKTPESSSTCMSRICSLPTDVLHLVVSLLQNDLRSTRYVLTACKCMMHVVRDSVYRRMRLHEHGLYSLGTVGTVDREVLQKTSASTTASLLPMDSQTLETYRAASLQLSIAMVTVGIPHRMLTRMRAHKLRGNAEFKERKFARALCHYMLIITCFSKLSIYFDQDFVIPLLHSTFAPDFDFQEAHKMDIDLLYAVYKKDRHDTNDTYTFGIDEILKEYDERVLGYVSRASSELDEVCITALCNASLCLLKLGMIPYALQFAKYAKKAPTHVKGWRGQRKYHFKAEVRIGQALQAAQRFEEAKEIFLSGLNRSEQESSNKKVFRKMLKKLKNEEEEWRNGFRNKLEAVNENDFEKAKEQQKEEVKRRAKQKEQEKDDIF
jgi:hypothetical protein